MRALAVLLGFLMLPTFAYIGMVGASQTNLIDAGITDEMNPPLVLWEKLSDGRVLTVASDGNVSMNTFSNGQHGVQWTVQLEVNALCATVDAAEQLIAVGHGDGAYIIHIGLQVVNRNISIGRPVDDLNWDDEGDLWLVHFAGRRRAEEYNGEGATGIVSPNVQSGISSFLMLSNNYIMTASMDANVYISTDNGVAHKTLTEPLAISYALAEDSAGRILVGSSDGILYRYNVTDWSYESLSLSHGKSITDIEILDDGSYSVGAKSGKLSLVDDTTFTETITYSPAGASTSARVIASDEKYNGAMFIITSTPTATQVRMFDLDSDLDGVTDRLDDFPNEVTQWKDSDGDGYGDNQDGFEADAFPDDATQHLDSDGDGYGDDPTGNNGDLFPLNADQWQDTDGDTYGDNSDGENGDKFPSEPTQWANADGDLYGDNPEGFQPDACPDVSGFSTIDVFGCVDSDFDGYSDAGDDLPHNPTQFEDNDNDGYGDNQDGTFPDTCPWEHGNSTKAWVENLSVEGGFEEIVSYGCLDKDGDGWFDSSESEGMDSDPNEHYDGDRDGVGSNSDYDDTKPLIQTEEDHCNLNFEDMSDACLGWRSEDYQAYLARSKGVNETDLDYASWNTSKNAGLLEEPTEVDTGLIANVATVGGVVFLALTIVIIVFSVMQKKKKTAALVKMYGVPYVPKDRTASFEALKGEAGLSASGGVEADSSWDDEIAEFNFDQQADEFAMNLDDNSGPAIAADDLYGSAGSIEEIAGAPGPIATPQPETQPSAPQPQPATPTAPSEAPPLPPSGLPDGWTMDQWRWYGHEWLAKYGNN